MKMGWLPLPGTPVTHSLSGVCSSALCSGKFKSVAMTQFPVLALCWKKNVLSCQAIPEHTVKGEQPSLGLLSEPKSSLAHDWPLCFWAVTSRFSCLRKALSYPTPHPGRGRYLEGGQPASPWNKRGLLPQSRNRGISLPGSAESLSTPRQTPSRSWTATCKQSCFGKDRGEEQSRAGKAQHFLCTAPFP